VISFTLQTLYPLGKTTFSSLPGRLHVKDKQSEHFKEGYYLFKNSNFKISFKAENIIGKLLARNQNINPKKLKCDVYQHYLLKIRIISKIKIKIF